MAKIELTRSPFIKTALKSRYPQLAVFIVMLVGYIFAIIAGLVGTPVGSHNFSIVFVWIAWWAILILVAVPFFGRGWCAVCPIPLPGEWLQRGAILAPPDKRPKWLHRRWPSGRRDEKQIHTGSCQCPFWRSPPNSIALPKFWLPWRLALLCPDPLFHYACPQFRGDRGNETHEPTIYT